MKKFNDNVSYEKLFGEHVFEMIKAAGIRYEFNEEINKQLESIPTKLVGPIPEGYEDHRYKVVFTIDSKDTKDIDDAVSIERIDEDYLLTVYIADVSHYVEEFSPIDIEAMQRGTSVYSMNQVIPMLPKKLSNGICSLNEYRNRLTKACRMRIGKDGQIKHTEIINAIICSNLKMRYDEINDIFNGEEPLEKYEPFLLDLYMMRELSSAIDESVVSLDFDAPELSFEFDEEKHPVEVSRRERGIAENMIENFMVTANMAVTMIADQLGIPFIYRVHPKPRVEKLQDVVRNFALSNIISDANYEHLDDLRVIRDIIEQVKQHPASELFCHKLLKHTERARYSPDNTHHFGLGLDQYTHFTSPIRRYADLTVHRLFNKYLENPNITKTELESEYERLTKICSTINSSEQRVDNVTHNIEQYNLLEYLKTRVGSPFEAFVDFDQGDDGISIQTKDFRIKGFISPDKAKMLRVSFIDEETIMCMGEQIYVLLEGIKKRTPYFAPLEHTNKILEL